MIRGMIVCVILVSVGLTGCIGIGGTNNEHRPTTGQELIDLKAALDRGAMTQTEYDAKKAEILRKHG